MGTFHEVAALVVFVAVVIGTVVTVLWPISVPLPGSWRKHVPFASVSISYAGVPVAGTLLMLATGVLDGKSFAAGIVGDDRMKPYGIVILFMALAYMSTALDMTGCFQWLALHITRMSRGNGLALFFLYYGLSSVLTIFTSNDVSIMALTPIIYYFALATGADPIPFLTAEFTAANIWSMLLFVGNPTNIIVAMAYRLGFLEYSKWMALPTIAAGFAALGAVLALQWHSIPKHLALPDVHPSVMLVDKPGALLGATNILVCLGLLAAAPALQWELWVVTLVCALLHALYCFIAYVGCKGRWCKVPAAPEPAPGTAGEQQESVSSAGCVESGAAAAATSEDREAAEQQQAAAGVELVQQQQQHFVAPAASEEGLHQRHPQHPQQHQELEGCRWRASLDAVDGTGTEGPGASCLNATEQPFVLSRGASRVQLLSAEQHAACSDAPAAAVFEHSGDGFCAASCEDGRGGKATGAAPVATAAAAALPGSGPGLRPPPAPTFWHAVVVLPWEVVPFVLGMFCVVEGLNATGWVDSLAAWLAAGLGGNVWGALFGIGLLSLLLANIINNQPMTILMTRVCMSPAFTAPLAAAGGGVPLASAFAVVVASNTAANFSVMGALAGIMFCNILAQRGMTGLSYLRFSKLMVPAGVASTLLALVVLGAEFATWGV